MNHNKNIKVYQTLTKFSLLVLTFFLLSFNLTCKDPEEFKPVDSLLPPPQPPEFSLPLADTIFWIPDEGPDTIGAHVTFDWSVIEDAEIYEINIDTNLSFDSPEFERRLKTSSPTVIGILYYHTKPTYFSRIRAGSNLWTWFTDWSEIKKFQILRDTTGNSASRNKELGLNVGFK
ncbi:hypothetical protein KAX97_04440 [candidate division WOR-3 bacterium]|nr:hypothetical protein [candidate division WOR-3 bacterium]